MKDNKGNLSLPLLSIVLSALALWGPSTSLADSPQVLPAKKASTTSPALNFDINAKDIRSTPQFTDVVQKRIDKYLSDRGILMGTKDGGGGDDLALEFSGAVEKALSELKLTDPKTYSAILAQGVESTVKNARIVVVDDALDVDFMELIQTSVAFNSPKYQIILVNREKWKTISNDGLKKSIALHEVLSLMGLEKTGSYPISGRYWVNISVKNLLRKKDVGSIPQAIYNCSTTPDNMIGIGIEYQVVLTENSSKIIYSQNAALHMELGRTRNNFPATVTNQGRGVYSIQARYYNSENSTFREEELLLDTSSLSLSAVQVDGRLIPVPCKVVGS